MLYIYLGYFVYLSLYYSLGGMFGGSVDSLLQLFVEVKVMSRIGS